MHGFISPSSIEAVRDRVDIVAVIGEYTQLESRGSDYWGLCPFHKENTPSFHVDPSKKFYHCFSCGAGGDTVKFVMEMEKLSYPEAIESLAKKCGIEIIYQKGLSKDEENAQKEKDELKELYSRIASTFYYLLTETEGGKPALEYLLARGLTLETIQKFKLGYAPPDRTWLKKFLRSKNYSDEFLAKSGLFSKKYPDVSLFSARVMFPIFDKDGNAVAFGGRILLGEGPKYLNSPEMIHYKKREVLYAFNFAKKSIKEIKAVIICEGYMDAIAYHQCGVEYAVAPLGTSLTEDHVRFLARFVQTVYLSFDSDGAGQNATFKAIILCRKQNLTVKVIKLIGAKDPAEIMLNFGQDVLTNSIKNAILDNEYLLSKLLEKFPEDSPEAKTKAALAFFPYIDALNFDMQKDSCLNQFSQAFKLNPDSVKRDFNNREEARQRARKFDENRIKKNDANKVELKPTTEVRAVLSVLSNLDQFKVMREKLTVEDFVEPVAKELFTILEECFKQEDLSFTNILEHCKTEELQNMITNVITSGEFPQNNLQTVQDSIRMIKIRKMERQREKLMTRIRGFTPVTKDDEQLLSEMLSQKMLLDKEIKNYKE